MSDSIPETSSREQFRKMGSALKPKEGKKRSWSQQPEVKAIEIKESDVGNANSFGDGRTLYTHGKTFNKR